MVKVASETLRARLAASASENFRTVDQEALARLERSFEMEDVLIAPVHQKWVDEALAGEMRSGSQTPSFHRPKGPRAGGMKLVSVLSSRQIDPVASALWRYGFAPAAESLTSAKTKPTSAGSARPV